MTWNPARCQECGHPLAEHQPYYQHLPPIPVEKPDWPGQLKTYNKKKGTAPRKRRRAVRCWGIA